MPADTVDIAVEQLLLWAQERKPVDECLDALRMPCTGRWGDVFVGLLTATAEMQRQMAA